MSIKKYVFIPVLISIMWAVDSTAVQLIVPPVKCSLKDGNVMAIGSGAKGSEGLVEWDGGNAKFQITNGRFNVAIKLKPGKQKVKFTTGSDSLEAEWIVGGKENLFAYHEEVSSNSCSSCHDLKNLPSEMEDVSSICYGCHDSFMENEHVHGPVGMGMCAACHSPHGSTQTAFLRVPTTQICKFCHEGPVKPEHPKSDGPCITCHDPHGSAKSFQIK